jgi:uncharacterized protein YggE
MKRTLFTLLAVGFSTILLAQQPAGPFINNPYPKTISVSGSAEMEIIPDEIFVNITLAEYQKKGENKKDIETIKSQFFESAKGAGIPDSLISIVSFSGSNNYYSIRKKKKDPGLAASIIYQVKFKSSKLMDDLVERLDDNATQNFEIVSVSHSRMSEFRRQLKIKAIQAAKEKGLYLTEAVGEKLGEAITINEPGEWQPYFANTMANNAIYTYRDQVNDKEIGTPELDFKKIKLRFEVAVVFALK